jgi:hypothetical protein
MLSNQNPRLTHWRLSIVRDMCTWRAKTRHLHLRAVNILFRVVTQVQTPVIVERNVLPRTRSSFSLEDMMTLMWGVSMHRKTKLYGLVSVRTFPSRYFQEACWGMQVFPFEMSKFKCSKVKTIYLPKSVKVSFSFCPWQAGLGVGWVGSGVVGELIDRCVY